METSDFLLPAVVGAIALSTATKKTWSNIPKEAAPYLALIYRAEQSAEIPPTLLARLIYQESRFKPNATNPTGASGLMQIVPAFHPNIDPFNPIVAIPYGANYLASLYRRFKSWPKALAAYNWGGGNVAMAVKKYGDNWLNAAPLETRNYVSQIGRDVSLS